MRLSQKEEVTVQCDCYVAIVVCLLACLYLLLGQGDQGMHRTSAQSWCFDSYSGSLGLSQWQYLGYGFKFSSNEVLLEASDSH